MSYDPTVTALSGSGRSKLLGSITDKGPSVVVVRDTDGHVFGGYAPESWHCNGEFYGEPMFCLSFSTGRPPDVSDDPFLLSVGFLCILQVGSSLD